MLHHSTSLLRLPPGLSDHVGWEAGELRHEGAVALGRAALRQGVEEGEPAAGGLHDGRGVPGGGSVELSHRIELYSGDVGRYIGI